MADLLADWQISRSPRLADEIEALGPDKAWTRLAKLPGSRAKTAILNLSKVQDPRIATLYVGWLAIGSWPAPTAKIVWERIFAHLVTIRDVRVIEPLRAIATNLPPFVGQGHRVWMVDQITATANSLAQFKPLKDARYRSPKASPVKPVADLAAPVWKDPDDDDLRQVVADAMLERGDPWGELITLQLVTKPNARQRSRIKQLLAGHATTWLGPIARLTLDGSWRFERGFPVAVATDRRAVPRREWEAALEAPQWATIRSIAINILETPKWWITAWVAHPNNRALAFEIGSLDYCGLRLERAALGQQWRLTSVKRASYVYAPYVKAFGRGLRPGESLVMAGDLWKNVFRT